MLFFFELEVVGNRRVSILLNPELCVETKTMSVVKPLRFTGYDAVHLTGATVMALTSLYLFSRYGTEYPIELIILGVAFICYILLSSVPNNYWLRVRYYDWFITVPLLVYVVSQYGSVPFWLLGGLAFLMLMAGFVGVLGKEIDYNMFIVLGFVFFLIFYALLITSGNTLPWWIYIFFFTWGIYGFVDRLEGPRDHWAYTVLDIINKPVFIILLLQHLSP